MEKYMLSCWFRKTFGFDCIGCGIQRSFLLLLEGRFKDAFFMFPAIYTSVLLFVFIALHLFEKKHQYHKIVIGFAILNALVMIIAYVYKMFFIFN
jgi:hypothetical protein